VIVMIDLKDNYTKINPSNFGNMGSLMSLMGGQFSRFRIKRKLISRTRKNIGIKTTLIDRRPTR
jgi:hypothetical protein